MTRLITALWAASPVWKRLFQEPFSRNCVEPADWLTFRPMALAVCCAE